MTDAWTVSGDLLTAKYNSAVCGSISSALSFGGSNGSVLALSESFNGTTWSVEGQLSEARGNHCGAGVLSDAKCMRGMINVSTQAGSEEYNGTAWSTFSSWGGGNSGVGAAGISDILVFGGNRGDGDPASDNTYYYNGTSWSYANDMNIGHPMTAGAGLGTDAIASGSYLNETCEKYNGSTWSITADINSFRNYCAIHGLSSKATVFGGRTDASTYTDTTEDFDGTAWTTSIDLNSVVFRHSGCGSATDSGLSCGGYLSIPKATTEIKEEVEVRETPGKHRAEVGIVMPIVEGSEWAEQLAAMFEAWYESSGITEAEAVLGYEIAPRTRSSYALVGDSATGEIYALDMNTYTDAAFPIRRTRRTQIINKNRTNVIHNRVEVEFESGIGLNKESTEDGYDPQATLKWSDDGGNNWSAGRTVSIGQFQQYGTRAVWRCLGKSRNRIYELTIEEPVKTVLVGTYAQIKACKF